MCNELKGLKLANTFKFNNKRNLILIGTNCYFDVVSDQIKRIKDMLMKHHKLAFSRMIE